MDKSRIHSPFLLLFGQPEDTQGGEGRCPHLCPLQLSDPLADESRRERHDSCTITNNPYIISGWRDRSWKRCLRQDFGAPSLHEFSSNRTFPSVPRPGFVSSGDRRYPCLNQVAGVAVGSQSAVAVLAL